MNKTQIANRVFNSLLLAGSLTFSYPQAMASVGSVAGRLISMARIGSHILDDVFQAGFRSVPDALKAKPALNARLQITRSFLTVSDGIVVKEAVGGIAAGAYKVVLKESDKIDFVKLVLKEGNCNGASCAQALNLAEADVPRFVDDINAFTSDFNQLTDVDFLGKYGIAKTDVYERKLIVEVSDDLAEPAVRSSDLEEVLQLCKTAP